MDSLYARLRQRYPLALVVLQFQFAHLVVAFGVFELTLYVDTTQAEFWRILAVAQILMAVDNLVATRLAWRSLRPARRWLAGDRSVAATAEAWRALATLPRTFAIRHRFFPIFFNTIPFCAYTAWELGLPFTGFFALFGGGLVVVAYGVVLRYFAMELALRPMLEEVARGLPADVPLGPAGFSLRIKLLAAIPMINIVTGSVVASITLNDPTLSDLFESVVVAVAVSLTASLWVTFLLARSIMEPVQGLRDATSRMAAGDLEVRVPVTSADETGAMAQSFNEMAAGLAERERLREAFGAYVDPDVAQLVLERGVDLQGEEVEVSVLFLDIRSFTAWAERASAPAVLARLNDFYETVVPVILRHGGHANKFIGDGLLAVFGAPDRRGDHADRAVAAALEIARTVDARFGDSIRIGIGVNSGDVVAGSVGGGGRVEFSVLGDAVNTAARVEEATRRTGDTILITDCTKELLTRDIGGCEERLSVELKGKRDEVVLWAPCATAGVEELEEGDLVAGESSVRAARRP